MSITDAVPGVDAVVDASHRYFVDSTEADQGVATATGDRTIKDHVDAIGATKKATLYLLHDFDADETDYTLTTNITISSNITLERESGAVIDGAGTLTINGPFKSDLSKAFGPSINIVGLKEVYPQLWGAVGDGSNDDTAALQAALGLAMPVYLPKGQYNVTSDITLVEGNIVTGAGKEQTFIQWASASDPTNAVIYNAETGYLHNISISDITIDAGGKSNGVLANGWNEFCGFNNVDIVNYTGTGIEFGGSTYTSQHFLNTNLRVVNNNNGANIGLNLNNSQRIIFNSFTVDSDNAASSGHTVGIRVNGKSHTFTGTNIEDCGLPIQMVGGNGNVFINVQLLNFSQTKDTILYDGITGTFGVTIDSAVRTYTFISIRDNSSYNPADILIQEEVNSRSIPQSKNDGFYSEIVESNQGIFRTDFVEAYGRIVVTASTDALDVEMAKIILCDTTAGNIVIGGMVGGTLGQELTIVKLVTSNDLTIEHNEGTGNQDILNHGGNDITASVVGGFRFVFYDGFWREISY